MEKTATSRSVEETIQAGIALASSLQERSTILLSGPLGAGKTHFAKGFLEGMGSDAEVSSPSFSLVHEYPTRRGPVFHLDFYRLNNASEVWGLGWEDLVAEGTVLVEWGERFPEVFPKDAIRVQILPISSTEREIRINPMDSRV